MISGAALIAPLAALFLVGVALALRSHRFLRRAVRTRARVVDRQASTAGTDSTQTSSGTYFCTVEFTDPAGRHHRVALSDAVEGGAGGGLLAKDNTLPILYDPDDPLKARLEGPPHGAYWVAAFCMAPAVLYALFLAVVKVLLVTGAAAP